MTGLEKQLVESLRRLRSVEAPLEPREDSWRDWISREGGVFWWVAEDLDVLWQRRAAAIWERPGSAKTSLGVLCLAALVRSGRAKRPVVVAPSSVLRHGAWQDEMRRVGGFPELRLVSFEGLPRQRRVLEEADAVWLDEAHRLRSRESVWAKVLRASPARYRYAATGTPFAHSLEDAVAVLEWLGLLPMHPKAFLLTFGHRSPKTQAWGILPYWEGEITRWIQSFVLRHDLGESLRLPTRRERVLWLGRGRFDPGQILRAPKGGTLARVLRLDDEATQRKLAFSARLAERWARRGRRVLLWVRSPAVAEALAGLTGTEAITGETPDGRREVILQAFRDGRQPILPLTFGVGGVGWNLPEASVSIFVQMPWSPTLVEQAIGRMERPGQREVPVVDFVLCRGSVDEVAFEVVHRRKESFETWLSRLARGGEAA